MVSAAALRPSKRSMPSPSLAAGEALLRSSTT
jgi:hypothetical protein